MPMAGLVIGNAMNATVLAARRIVEELRDKRLEVEARLALGQPSRRRGAALRPHGAAHRARARRSRRPRRSASSSCPGAMTGLILAGVNPLDAVIVQVVVMYLVLGSAATATAVVAPGLVRRLFTPDHRLVGLPRPADE